jgi:hypothetical protein
MCEFPSWEKCADGTVLYLTDKDVGRLTAWAEGDLYGHAALILIPIHAQSAS